MFEFDQKFFDEATFPNSSVKQESGFSSFPLAMAKQALRDLQCSLDSSIDDELKQFLPDVVLDISQNTSVNAFTKDYNRNLIVGINSGLIVMLWNMAVAFSDFFNAGFLNHKAYNLGGQKLIEFTQLFEENCFSKYESGESNDALIASASFIEPMHNLEVHRYVFRSAVQIIALHELSHIWGGHTEQLLNAHGHFEEFGMSASDLVASACKSVSPAYSQLTRKPISLSYMLEEDADGIAAELFLRSRVWDNGNLDDVIEIVYRDANGELDERRVDYAVYMFCNAQLIIFFCFSYLRSKELKGLGTHPNELLRLASLITRWYNYVANGNVTPTLADAFMNRTSHVMKTWAAKKLPGFELATQFGDDFRYHRALRYSARKLHTMHDRANGAFGKIMGSQNRIVDPICYCMPWPEKPFEDDRVGREQYFVRFLSLLFEPDGSSKYLDVGELEKGLSSNAHLS